MERPRTVRLWHGTVVLAVAALVTKILSAFYRIPYQNIVGDVGFYIYQQVYPIYAVMMALATSGYPVVISKLVAERVEENDEQGVFDVLRTSFFVLGAIGMFFFFFALYRWRTAGEMDGGCATNFAHSSRCLFFFTLSVFSRIARLFSREK